MCTSLSSTVATRPAGIGRTRIHSCSSIRRRCSTASRRPCSVAAPCKQSGPEEGLQERARQSEIQAYYDDILRRRFLGSGRVTFLGASDYHTDGSSHLVTSRLSGEALQINVRRRVVDATYLSPTIPATTPPPFGVADDVRVVAINELARLDAAPNWYVIVGSGKTATDGIVWLLANGVQQDRIVWVRPRDPWMLNRAVVQPDPAVALGLAADTMAAAAEAESLDDLFLAPRSCRRDAADRQRTLSRRWRRPRLSARGSSICSAPSRTSFGWDTSST